MKKLPLKLVRIIFIVGLGLSIAVYLCGYLLSVAALAMLGMAFLAADCVFAFLFYRCPHCHAFLGRCYGDYCTYCGEKLYL